MQIWLETRLQRINPSLEQYFYTQGLRVHAAKTEPIKMNKNSCHVLKAMLTQRYLRILLRLLRITFFSFCISGCNNIPLHPLNYIALDSSKCQLKFQVEVRRSCLRGAKAQSIKRCVTGARILKCPPATLRNHLWIYFLLFSLGMSSSNTSLQEEHLTCTDNELLKMKTIMFKQEWK